MTLPLFLIPLFAGLIAQGLKPFFNRQLYTSLPDGGRTIPRYGGMPSAHSAFVFSLATVVGAMDGIWSTTFAIAVAGVILILDDALRLRIFLAGFGQALHRLVHKLPADERATYPYVETRLGHKPTEVIVGAGLGIIISLVTLFLVS